MALSDFKLEDSGSPAVRQSGSLAAENGGKVVGATTFNRMTLRIMTLIIIRLYILTLSIRRLC